MAVLFLFAYPLGIAAQTGLLAIAMLSALPYLWRERIWVWDCCQRFAVPLSLSLLLPLWLAVSTQLNPANPASGWSAFGYFYWCTIPLFAVCRYPAGDTEWRRWERVLAGVCLCWGIVALSQVLFPWRVQGMAFVPDSGRARGFYSHPLTFAYAALLPWPLALSRLFQQPRRWQGWTMVLSLCIAILASQSRTVALIAICMVPLLAWRLLAPRVRFALLGSGVLLLLAVISVPNPIGARIWQTFSPQGVDRHQEQYADDRIAFWAAHRLMISERPLLGHGEDLNTAYRVPYYERLGLINFRKPYEAHNLYLQIAAEGGATGLSIFLLWFLWHLRAAWQLERHAGVAPVFSTSLLAFALAGLTQNSFQDGEVRVGLSLLVAALWVRQQETTRRELPVRSP